MNNCTNQRIRNIINFDFGQKYRTVFQRKIEKKNSRSFKYLLSVLKETEVIEMNFIYKFVRNLL